MFHLFLSLSLLAFFIATWTGRRRRKTEGYNCLDGMARGRGGGDVPGHAPRNINPITIFPVREFLLTSPGMRSERDRRP